MSNKPILISLSPNVEKDDIVLAFKLFFKNPKGACSQLEEKFRKYLPTKHAFTFNSGRTAFLAILKSLNLERGEVLLQAFTCGAVVNPIIKAGLKPIFVDIDKNTLNMDANDLEKKISDKSRAVVVQHTFGQPADLEKISAICQRHNLILIEDCAHCLGATYNEQKLGTFGKAAFFSFGRDKVISAVSGGMAVTNDDALAKKLQEFQQNLASPSWLWTWQQLLHPILNKFFVIPLYEFFGMGKWLLIFLLKTSVLSKAVKNEEKQGQMPDNFAKKIPDKLALLALNQFDKLERILNNQKRIANFYQASLKNLDIILPSQTLQRIYMRYPVLLKSSNADKILSKARQQNIFLDDGWRKTAIVPPDTNQEKSGYQAGSCPRAEIIAQTILNLPTHINVSKNDTQRIIRFIKSVLE